MFNFPTSSFYGKKIPKEKFYSKLEINSKLRQNFVNDIEQITWLHKLAASTINVGTGKTVVEIDIIQVALKKKECHYPIFEFLDKNLPKHNVFLLTFANEAQLIINYKESIVNRIGKHKITATYQTEWLPSVQINLTIEGLNLDKVYENFVAQIAGQKLDLNAHTDIKKAIAQVQDIEKLQKDIAALKAKIKNEKQFNIQIKHSEKLKKLKHKLKNLQDGKT